MFHGEVYDRDEHDRNEQSSSRLYANMTGREWYDDFYWDK